MSLKRGKISKDEKVIIEKLYSEGTAIEEIAEQLNRGLDPVYKVIKSEGYAKKQVKVQESFLANKGGGRVVARPNTWSDDTIELLDQKEQIQKDSGLYILPPTPRGKRKAIKEVKSICKKCEKEEMVHPSLSVDGEHVCKGCIGERMEDAE